MTTSSFRRAVPETASADELVDALARPPDGPTRSRAAQRSGSSGHGARSATVSSRQLRALEELTSTPSVERRQTVLVRRFGARTASRRARRSTGRSVAFPPQAGRGLLGARARTSRSRPRTSRATSTRRAGWCSSAASSARACSGSARRSDVATGPPGDRRVAGEVGELAGLLDDVDLVRPDSASETHRPTVVAARATRRQGERSSSPVRPSSHDAPLGRLDGEGPARAAAVAVEGAARRDARRGAPDVVAVDPPVVDARAGGRRDCRRTGRRRRGSTARPTTRRAAR